MQNYLVVCIFFLCSIYVQGQVDVDIKPVLAFQFWGASSAGTFDYSNNTSIDSRITLQLRRSRIGIKGGFNERLRFAFVGASDNVGKDLYDGVVGGPNNGPSPRIRLWDAYGTYKINQNNDLLHVTFGYFSPRVTRESITSPFKVNSLEKSWTQNYIRRHIVGTGPGRSIGLNIGGMYISSSAPLAISYNIGYFNPLYSIGSITSGQKSSNILAFRGALHIGDPGIKNYSSARLQNYFGQRKGITLAYSISHQGTGSNFNSNDLISWDLLANWGPINLMGEWAKLNRVSDGLNSNVYTWVAKFGLNHNLSDHKHLEAVISYVAMDGGTDTIDFMTASELGTFSGEDNYTELSLNYYPSNKVKFQIAYTWRNGSVGEQTPELARNNYYNQSGIVFRRPNYLALGWNITI